jgi:hypothetical protein
LKSIISKDWKTLYIASSDGTGNSIKIKAKVPMQKQKAENHEKITPAKLIEIILMPLFMALCDITQLNSIHSFHPN